MKKQIRNIAILGNVETGKLTLLNLLLGMSNKPHQVSPEEERGVFLMHTGEFDYQDRQILATYICTKGSLDFFDEISSVLRVVDGAFVLIDALEGVSVLVETALRKCMEERVQPILILTKLDTLFQFAKYDEQKLYNIITAVIQQVNDILLECEGFICNIRDNFLYASLKYKLVINKKAVSKILEKNEVMHSGIHKEIWFNYSELETSKDKKWTIDNIINPVCQLISAFNSHDHSHLEQVLASNVSGKQFPKLQDLDALVDHWFNYKQILQRCIVNILPSPQKAQQYRTPILYTGDLIDPCGQSMLKCSPHGPLMMYITNTISDPDSKSNVYRLARVFSGTLTKGDKVRILDRKYKFGSKSNMFQGSIKQIMQSMGGSAVFLESAGPGSLVCVTGVDHKVVRAATITNFELAHPIAYLKTIEKRIAAFVGCDMAHYPKMLEHIKTLSKSRQGLRYKIEETGEVYVLGSNIESVMAYIQDLKAQLDFQITTSEPFVKFKETITQPATEKMLAVSANGLNTLCLNSSPIDGKLCDLIENKEIKFYGDKELRNATLVNQFQWDEQQAMRIWSFGPEQNGPNILVDKTTHIKNISSVKGSVIQGFNIGTYYGALVEEPLRGMRVDLQSFDHSEDGSRIQLPQIVKTTSRGVRGCQLLSSPALIEPIFLCEIKIKGEDLKEIQQMIKLCRGSILRINDLEYKKIIDAYIPAVQKRVFEDRFRSCAPIREYFQSIYHHDQIIQDFSLEKDSPTLSLILQIRKMKGLDPKIPSIQNYVSRSKATDLN